MRVPVYALRRRRKGRDPPGAEGNPSFGGLSLQQMGWTGSDTRGLTQKEEQQATMRAQLPVRCQIPKGCW